MNNRFQTKTLTNFTIKELTNKWDKIYYLIVNEADGEEAYFCYQNKIDEASWNILVQNSPLFSSYHLEVEFEEYHDSFHDKTFRHVIKLSKK